MAKEIKKPKLITIDPEVLEALKEYVEKTGQSLKWFASSAIKEKMEREPIKKNENGFSA